MDFAFCLLKPTETLGLTFDILTFILTKIMPQIISTVTSVSKEPYYRANFYTSKCTLDFQFSINYFDVR